MFSQGDATEEVNEEVICLTELGYAMRLTCRGLTHIKVSVEQQCYNTLGWATTIIQSTVLQVVETLYGANTANCTQACCPDHHVQCTYTITASKEVIEDCERQKSCSLESQTDIPVVEIPCGGVSTSASFALIKYRCVPQGLS